MTVRNCNASTMDHLHCSTPPPLYGLGFFVDEGRCNTGDGGQQVGEDIYRHGAGRHHGPRAVSAGLLKLLLDPGGLGKLLLNPGRAKKLLLSFNHILLTPDSGNNILLLPDSCNNKTTGEGLNTFTLNIMVEVVVVVVVVPQHLLVISIIIKNSQLFLLEQSHLFPG